MKPAEKVKNTVPWTFIISDLNEEEIVGIFYEKELQKINQKGFWVEKVIKRKTAINYMLNEKDTIIRIIAG